MTLLMLLTYLVIAWCFYYDIVISIIVYVLIGFGAVGYLWAYIMLRCFKPYLPEEDLHAQDESVLLHEADAEDADAEDTDAGNAGTTETKTDDETESDNVQKNKTMAALWQGRNKILAPGRISRVFYCYFWQYPI